MGLALNLPTMPWNALSAFSLWLTATLAISGAALGQRAALDYPDIKVTSTPNWVVRATAPEARSERLQQVQEGVYYLLSDTQSRLANDHYVYYRRIAMQVTNRTGLEQAARLKFTFDPVDEQFSVHSIHVVRDGETIDRLDPEAFIIARQESDMASGVTDGELTVYMEIPDVRVGDIIDYEISWKNQPSLWPGEYSSNFSIQWSVPLGFYRKRVLAPSSRSLTIKTSDPQFKPVISTHGAYTEYVWTTIDADTKTAQSVVPQTFANWGYVSISTFDEWGSVAASLTPAYNEDLNLPDGFIASEHWFSDDSNISAKITAAIRYAQDNIRYVADETGVGSHVPRKPSNVIRRGWGDCKDKSLLLVAILRSLGVESYVVLTDLDSGFALPQKAPSPFVFDHAIVVYIIDGKRYWIDPTSFQQGGNFPNIAQPIYGYGLPLKQGVENLWEIQPDGPDVPNKSVQEIFDFAGFHDDGITLRVESEYAGREADQFRRQLETSSKSKLSKDYLDYYQKQYPGAVAVAEMDVTDDRDANRIIATERYSLAREHYEGKPIESAIPMRADAVLSTLTAINFSERTAPISLPYPAHYQHVFMLKNVGSDFGGTDDFEMSTDHFEYSRKYDLTGEDAKFSYLLKILSPEAPLSLADNYAATTTDLDDYGNLEINLLLEDETDTEITLILIGAIAALVALIYLPFGIRASFKRDEQLASQSVFYPVSPLKFIILNIATLGGYSLFWMWRCWRWVKANGADEIMPFWRTFFSVIWFFPLFSEIKGHREDSRIPAILGVLLAIGYVLMAIVGGGGEIVYGDNPTMSLATSLVDGLAFLLILPFVIWVNQLNDNEPEILRENSRWNVHTYALLGVGAVIWAIVIYGSVPSEV
jgi:transglutaminase-like putative cysteine protease